MKKFLVFCVILACAVTAAAEENLYNIFKDKSEAKVFLKDVTLVPVDNKNASDVVINAKIKKYTFTKNAMPRPFGAATLVADALSAKSSGAITVDYQVRKPSKDSLLLGYKNFSTETRRPQKDMEGERGYTYTVLKNTDTFVHKALCKPHAK